MITPELLDRARRTLEAPREGKKATPELLMLRELLLAAEETWPTNTGDRSIVLGPAALPALAFLSHEHTINLTHPTLDAGCMTRLEARLVLAMLDHVYEIVRAAHNLD